MGFALSLGDQLQNVFVRCILVMVARTGTSVLWMCFPELSLGALERSEKPWRGLAILSSPLSWTQGGRPVPHVLPLAPPNQGPNPIQAWIGSLGMHRRRDLTLDAEPPLLLEAA